MCCKICGKPRQYKTINMCREHFRQYQKARQARIYNRILAKRKEIREELAAKAREQKPPRIAQLNQRKQSERGRY